MRLSRCLAGVTGALCALLIASVASAQGGAGAIAGNVKDTTGGALPGVTIEVASPALIEKVRTAVTDGGGNYKITELRPGTYSVTFSLGGFSTYKREGIELSAGFTAPVSAELKVGSMEETITVTGAAPVVDVQSVRTQSVLKNETLDALPSGQRDVAQLASLTLGAMPSSGGRNDVGGDRGERSTGISLHGSRGDDSRLNYDGMNTNVFFGGAGGQQRTYKFNTVMVAEQVVDTGGNTSETETGGANVNMVPKEGGNKFSLSGTANFTNTDLASGKVPDSLIARGSAPDQNSMRKVWDYGVGIGGPIVQDKVWFYEGNRWWGSQSFVANNYFNKSKLFYRYEPDLSRPAYTNVYQKDFGGRLTWQLTSKQKLSVEQHYQDACACWESLTAATAPDGSTAFLYKPHYLSQGTWTYPATNKLLFQAGASLLRAQVQFLSVGGDESVAGRIRISDTNYPGIGAYAWGGIGTSVQTDNGDAQRQDNFNYRFATSYITGTHAVKLGYQGLRGTFNTRGNSPSNSVILAFNGGVPNSLTQYADPFKMNGRVQSQALYLSDQWTLKRLTLTAGVRYDHFNVGTLPIDIPAGRFIGARSYPARQDIPNYSDITPRVGAAFDVFGNGRTAIRGSWGRYLVGLGGGALTNLAPSNGIVASTTRPWNDSAGVATAGTGVVGNGNFVPDCDLSNFAANGECGPIASAGFGQSTTTIQWDDKARQGWGVREFSYQWNVSVQHELLPGFGVQGGFYRTDFRNTQVQVNTALSASSFDTFCLAAPTDARLGDVSGGQVCGLTNGTFAAKALVANNVWYRVEDAPVAGLTGRRSEIYNGGDVSLNWRFKGAGLVSGGLSVGKQVTDTCFANSFPQVTGTISAGGLTTLGLRDNNYCTNAAQPLWSAVGSQVKLQVVYPLPGQYFLAATYKHLPGAALTGTVTYANAAIAPTLGRNLQACTAATGACTQTVSQNIVRPGTLYDDRLNQIDLRGTRRFTFGRVRIQGIAELYNILNSRPAQSVTATWGNVTAPGVATPGTTYLRPSLLLGGRLFKFGTQIDW